MSNNTDVKWHRAKNRENNVKTKVQRSASDIQAQIDQLKQMMEKLEKTNKNKEKESYPCLLSELTHKSKRGKNIEKRKIKNKKHNTRRKIACHESNNKYIKNLSNI